MAARPPTSHDVARAAGVSQPTVSRALRGDPRVTLATRERVAAAARELGYVASDRGRSLSTRRTGRIGVVVEDLDNPFYLELLDELHERLEHADTRMIVFTPRHDDPHGLERLVDGSIDGVVLTTTFLDSPVPGALRDRGFPFVLLNRVVDEEGMTSCSVDNVRGGRLAARELLDAGHREIAAIFGPEQTSTGRDRERGLRAALHDAGAALAGARRGPYTYATGHAATLELLACDGRPTALFCGNDVIALGALNACRRLGLRVPEDVSVVGFDDTPLAAVWTPALSSVRIDFPELGRNAFELLTRMLTDDGDRRAVVQLPPVFVQRESTAPPRR
jgi:LacI family transcriptional regulator, galactose operon repressor